MSCTVMNKNILKIPSHLPQIRVVTLIKEAVSKNTGTLYVDLSETSFVLSRDFFLVLSKRIHRDQVVFVVAHDTELRMAQSI